MIDILTHVQYETVLQFVYLRYNILVVTISIFSHKLFYDFSFCSRQLTAVKMCLFFLKVGSSRWDVFYRCFVRDLALLFILDSCLFIFTAFFNCNLWVRCVICLFCCPLCLTLSRHNRTLAVFDCLNINLQM